MTQRECWPHATHCYQGEYATTCKYGDENCPQKPVVVTEAIDIPHPDRTLEQFRAQIASDIQPMVANAVVYDCENILERREVVDRDGTVEQQVRVVGSRVTLWYDEAAYQQSKRTQQ